MSYKNKESGGLYLTALILPYHDKIASARFSLFLLEF